MINFNNNQQLIGILLYYSYSILSMIPLLHSISLSFPSTLPPFKNLSRQVDAVNSLIDPYSQYLQRIMANPLDEKGEEDEDKPPFTLSPQQVYSYYYYYYYYYRMQL